MDMDERILECLQRIESSLSSDEYEVSDPFTVGGATGNYVIPSPYHTECEWCVISATAVGTVGSAATFAIGSKNPLQPSLSSTGADSFGNQVTSSPDNNNALQSYTGALTANAPMIAYGSANYMPLASPASVYLKTTTPATTELLVTIQFRRKLDRIIPATPRAKPHTHSHVGSRRVGRTMMEGYAAQYPRDAPYEHQPIPSQDTAMTGRTGLQPTTTKHRRMVSRDGR